MTATPRTRPTAAAMGRTISMGERAYRRPASSLRGVQPDLHAHPAAELDAVTQAVKRVIVGQDRVIERLLVGLLAKGHLLLEGVPGLAKTLAMETLATVVGGPFARIQFTPDLLPAAITGTRRSEEHTSELQSLMRISYAVFCLKK